MKKYEIKIKEVKEEILKSVICDECGFEKIQGDYISYCISDGHYPEAGYESYEVCSKKCLNKAIDRMTMEELDLMFTIDVYSIEE